MKIRLLPDIDLARIAPLPDDLKRKQLEQMKSGRPPFSYRPLRSCFDDIFNIQPELFGSALPTEWKTVEAILKKKSNSEIEFDHNKRVARGLFDFASSEEVSGRKHEFFPLSMGIGRKVTFWLPMILAIQSVPHALFVEPRRSRGLTENGRRFAFSMMHERIRAADEDFSSVRLGIAKFNEPMDGKRSVRLYTDEGVDLYHYHELELMVASTYEMWREVLEEREHEARRRDTGTGPLI